MFHCIAEGKAREDCIVFCFDGCKPDGWDWVTGGGMVESDKSLDAGEVIHAVGLRGHHSGGLGRRCSGGGVRGGGGKGEHKGGKWCLGLDH